jgi:hypothetical protein
VPLASRRPGSICATRKIPPQIFRQDAESTFAPSRLPAFLIYSFPLCLCASVAKIPMNNGNQPPFRMPCEAGAGAPRYFLGGPFQHALRPSLVDRFLNVTTVPNQNALVGGVVGPYERFTQDLSGGESCETHQCNPDAAPCSAWLRPFPENIFAHTPGDSANFAVTRQRGFKAVQARRNWNGRFGYLNKESTNAPDNVQGCGDETQSSWRAYTSAIDGTKFLGLDISAAWTQTTYNYSGGGAPTTSTSAETMAVSQLINADSGLITFSGLAISPNTNQNHALNAFAPALWKFSNIIARMTVEITPTPPGGSKICAGSSITLRDAGGLLVEQVDWNIGAGTFTRTTYIYDSLGAQLVDIEESVSVNNTQINYSSTANDYNTFTGSGLSISQTTVTQATGTLTNPHASASVYADIKNLLGAWNLADDAQYAPGANRFVRRGHDAACRRRDRHARGRFAFHDPWERRRPGGPVRHHPRRKILRERHQPKGRLRRARMDRRLPFAR